LKVNESILFKQNNKHHNGKIKGGCMECYCDIIITGSKLTIGEDGAIVIDLIK
jgi:hypothetical protein